MNVVISNGKAAVSFREGDAWPVTIKTKTMSKRIVTLEEARALRDMLTAVLEIAERATRFRS